MDIEIDSINVTVSGDDWDEDEIKRELQWYLSRALEELSKDAPGVEGGSGEFETLDLPIVDWEAETDKTGKLVQLIRNALEENINYGA